MKPHSIAECVVWFLVVTFIFFFVASEVEEDE